MINITILSNRAPSSIAGTDRIGSDSKQHRSIQLFSTDSKQHNCFLWCCDSDNKTLRLCLLRASGCTNVHERGRCLCEIFAEQLFACCRSQSWLCLAHSELHEWPLLNKSRRILRADFMTLLSRLTSKSYTLSRRKWTSTKKQSMLKHGGMYRVFRYVRPLFYDGIYKLDKNWE